MLKPHPNSQRTATPPIASKEEYAEIKQRIEMLMETRKVSFEELIKQVNELDNEDYLFVTNYADKIISKFTDWIQKYIHDLMQDQFTNFSFNITKDLDVSKLEQKFANDRLGTLDMKSQKMSASVADSNLNEINTMPLSLDKGLTYVNQDHSYKLDFGSFSLGQTQMNRNQKDGIITINDLSFKDFKLYIKK